MNLTSTRVCLISLSFVALSGCGVEPPAGENRFLVKEGISVGGQPVVSLSKPPGIGQGQLEILSADIFPGRGMNTFQMRAYLPGKGDIDVLVSPGVEEAQKRMNGGSDDRYGNESFMMGGAILLPFANRIRGRLSADKQTLTTPILGKEVSLPANWKGKAPNAPPHAMHGLMLASQMEKIRSETSADQASVSGTLEAGSFWGHWPAKTRVEVTGTLKLTAFVLTVTARNMDAGELPIGIGWHPYFALPSGNRAQARLRLPARQRALVNNYDDVFPTGKIVPVKGTPYDFTGVEGAPLGQLFLDDCLLDLRKTGDGRAVAEIIDPAAKYGVRVTAQSPEVRAFQVYAPLDRPLVVLEPQFNLADPYSKVWGNLNTGMVVLKPGGSVTYSVTVELFVP